MAPMKAMFFSKAAVLAVFAIASTIVPATAKEKLAVKSGETIAFLGDSITANGNRKGGYVQLVMQALKSEGLEVTHIPAGKSGNKSNNMLERLDSDVISKKPHWMLLSCGVNDVWHFQLMLGQRTFEGMPLDDYKKNITEIIDTAQKAGIQVMVLTSTMISEDPKHELNQMLEGYNAFLREIAKEKKCLLADLNKDMQEQLKDMPDKKGKAGGFGNLKNNSGIQNKLTSDGCHMNPEGNKMMARGILRAFGMSKSDLKKAEKDW